MKHFQSLINISLASQSSLQEELIIHSLSYSESKYIALQLNEYFPSVYDQFSSGSGMFGTPGLNTLKAYIKSKVPPHMYFTVSNIST